MYDCMHLKESIYCVGICLFFVGVDIVKWFLSVIAQRCLMLLDLTLYLFRPIYMEMTFGLFYLSYVFI